MEDKKIAPIGVRPPRPQGKGYGDAGASYSKKTLKGFLASSGSPHEDIDAHNYTLRQRARVLYMSAPIATSAIKTNRTNVIGCGLYLKSTIDRKYLGLSAEAAREWQRNTEQEFELWASKKNNCDMLGISNFYSAQGLLLAASLLSGDAFVLIKRKDPTANNPYGLRFQMVEADRISTPTATIANGGVAFAPIGTHGKSKDGNDIFDGVEVDADGSIVAYYIRNTYPFELTTKQTDWVRVEAYGKDTGLPNVLHIMEAERPEQYRGVTYLAQVIEPLLQLRRYTDSELVAAVVESFFTAFITSESGEGEMPLGEARSTDVPEVSTDDNEYEMGPGTVNVLKPGENVVFGDPKRPNGSFEAFVKAISKQLGAALEIPVDLLLKEFNSSYSASRAALLEAWKAFKMRREWFVDDFCRPIYEIWLYEAVARGRISAPGFFSDVRTRMAWMGSEWVGPSQGQLDPVKEIQAEKMACEEGFSTREQSTIRLNGGSYENNAEQLRAENEMLNSPGQVTASQAHSAEAFAAAVAKKILPEVLNVLKQGGQDA